jgi:tRNA(Ile)-lysidine synthase
MHTLERALADRWPPESWRAEGMLVGVSGGADSVALLRGLAAQRGGPGRLLAAHFNHALRGEESDRDEQFVVELCQRLGVPCTVGRGAPAGAGSDEASLRRKRYGFLQGAAEQAGVRYLAVAHTLDDQAETILHRIVRGTGLAGLAGMRASRRLGQAVTLVRPLLATRRGEVRDYLRQLGQAWCEDALNRDRDYTRNRLRLELLPRLAADFNPQVHEALVRLGQLALEAQEALGSVVENLKAECLLEQSAGGVVLACGVLARAPRHVVRELMVGVWQDQDWPLREMGLAHWEQLADLALGATDGRLPLPGGVEARRSGQRLEIRRGPTAG